MNELYHHGILGMKWGVRRYQNPDGTRTAAGKERYGAGGKTAEERKGLSDGRKKALKVGAVAAVACLGIWGASKFGSNANFDYNAMRALGFAESSNRMDMNLQYFANKKFAKHKSKPYSCKTPQEAAAVQKAFDEQTNIKKTHGPISFDVDITGKGTYTYTCEEDDDHRMKVLFRSRKVRDSLTGLAERSSHEPDKKA